MINDEELIFEINRENDDYFLRLFSDGIWYNKINWKIFKDDYYFEIKSPYYLLFKAFLYKYGLFGYKKNTYLAYKCYFEAQYHPIAQYNLGFMYEYGIYFEKNDIEALKWYIKAQTYPLFDKYLKEKIAKIMARNTYDILINAFKL